MADVNNSKDAKWAFMSAYFARDNNARTILPAQPRKRHGRINEVMSKARIHEYPFQTQNLRPMITYDPDCLMGVHTTPGREIY